VGGRDIGLQALLQRVDAEMARSADQAARLGQSYARLAQAQGQPALGSQILAGTMQRTGGASERALIGVATQQANLANSSRNLTSTIAGLGGQMSALGGTAGALGGQLGALAGGLGTVGGVGAALGIVKIGVEAGIAGANVQLLRERFDTLAESAGTTGDALLNALRVASGGEITDFNLQLAANKAQLLGVADSAQEFGVLMEIARDRAQQLGISTTQAFNDLVTGLGRGSALILDNLGIIVSVDEANKAYAASLGKTASALSEAEKKQALINQVLQQGQATLAASGGAVEGNANAFARAGVTLQNLGNTFSTFLSNGLAPYAASIGDAGEVTSQFIATMQGMGAANTQAATQLQANAAGQFAYNAAIAQGATATQAAAAFQTAYVGALSQTSAATVAGVGVVDTMEAARAREAAATNAARDSMEAYRGIQAQSTANAAAATAAQLANANSMELAGIQARAAALAAQQKGDADRVAAVDAQTHGVAEQLLAQQAQAAAQALINAGASGASAAAQLANSSSSVDVLTAAYYRLAAAQAAAAQAKTNAAAFADQRAGERDAGSGRTAAQITFEANQDRKAQASRLRRAEEAERALKKVRGGGGGGGAAVKLTDQQKLENQLLTSQEQFSTKSEDAEREHLNRILDINADFAERMRDAQEEFKQAQLDGRAGFYNSLGSIEDAGLRQALAAQYEAAFAEADKIAQEKGADVGEKFLQAKQAAIEAQGKRASEIAEAQKAGDKDKAEYLSGVDRLYREAEERKLKAIAEGQASLAAARDKQIADEAGQYAASQDKIGAAADTAAERKIAAAERAGKAIDAEAIKVDGLATKYDRVGVAGARAGVTPGPAKPETTTTIPPTTVTTAPAAEGQTLADLISQLMSKLDSVAGMIVGAEKSGADQVSGAVRSLSGRLVN